MDNFENNRKKIRLGDLLVENKLITQAQLETMLVKQRKSGKKLGELLVDDGILSEEDIAEALSQQLELPVVDLNEIDEESKYDYEIVFKPESIVPIKIETEIGIFIRTEMKFL